MTTPAWFPVKPFTVNRLGDLDSPGGGAGSVPGQREAAASSGCIQQMDLAVYYADAGQTDFVVPDIWQVDGLLFWGRPPSR